MTDTEKIKKLECYLCGSKVLILIMIQTASDSFLFTNKGICYECFKKGEIEERFFIKAKRYVQEQLEHAEDRVKTWQEEFEKLT